MIKYLFSDLDGTLVHNTIVADVDAKAVHTFVKNGGVFSIATGRTDLEISNFIHEEKFPEATYRISCNGAMITVDDEILFTEAFSQEAKAFLQKKFLERHADLDIEIGTENFVYFVNRPPEWILQYKGEKFEINPHVLQRFTDDDFKILKLFVTGNEAFVAELVAEIEAAFGDELDVFNDGHSVNLIAKNHHKGTGIQLIMEQYGIQPDEIAVIGDAANDVGMFEITPHSFTFHHATDAVKEKANHVVENVAEMIDIISKIKE